MTALAKSDAGKAHWC